MQKVIAYRFSTIALISGAPKYDNQLASVAKTLKKVSKENVDFVGVAGSEYHSLFEKVYAPSSLLDNYEFEVTRAYNSYHQDLQDSAIMPYRMYTHFRNFMFLKQLERQHFFEQVFENKFSSVVTFGNFSLALKIGAKLNQYAKQNKLIKPYTAFFHRQISERTFNNEQFLDFQYYNIQKALANDSGYTFPSLCVGYDGLFKAFQYLQTFKKDNQNDTFASQNFSYDVSELIKKSRAQYRTSKGISEDKYIIYINAGTDVAKIKFSFKAFKTGLSQFFESQKIRRIKHDHFEIFVQVPADEKLAAEINGKLGHLPQNFKITLINERDKYPAMSASDFGLIHNGEATVEAAALQLPSLVVDNMTNFHAYFNYLYNGHASPLNIATNFEGYEDLCGSLTAIGGKISALLLRGFETPKLRYYYAKLYREQIQKILSKSNTNPSLNVSETGLQTGCKHLLDRAATYSKLTHTTPFRRQGDRKQALGL